jgi:hypothetical protein
MAGVLVVGATDLDTGEPIAGASISVSGAAAAPEVQTTDESGTATFARDGSAAPLVVEASADGYVPARWIGTRGGRLVVPLVPRRTRDLVEIQVSGVGPAESAWIGSTARPSLFQASGLRLAQSDSMLAECVPAGDGTCRASLELDASPAGHVVLVAVASETGAAARLVRLEGVRPGAPAALAGGEELGLETVAVDLPPLPLGLTSVVGVPGVSFGDAVGVGLFPDAGTATLPLPVVAGTTRTRWALFLATVNEGGTPDLSRRSVLVDRRAEAVLGPWTAWLAPPALSVTGGVATLTPPAGASLTAIDWVDAANAIVRTDLVLDASIPIDVPAGTAAARVRSLEAPATASSLVVPEAERMTTRFSEADVTL